MSHFVSYTLTNPPSLWDHSDWPAETVYPLDDIISERWTASDQNRWTASVGNDRTTSSEFAPPVVRPKLPQSARCSRFLSCDSEYLGFPPRLAEAPGYHCWAEFGD